MLSSLVMINLWTPGKVKDFSLCLVGTAGGSINSQRGNANRRGCSDRLCVITEDSTEKVSILVYIVCVCVCVCVRACVCAYVYIYYLYTMVQLRGA